jgi:hypothetical protein
MGLHQRLCHAAQIACISLLSLMSLAFATAAAAQSFNGTIIGVVKDSSGGVVQDAALTLRNVATGQTVAAAVSADDGAYAFRNLAPAKYEVEATKTGFQTITHPNIEVTLGSIQRVDVTMPLGTLEQSVEVVGGSSVLHYTGTQDHGISPETLQELPLLVNGGPRSAANFAILMPGVSTGGQGSAFDARINGGLQSGDEATLDGVSMQQGFMSQGGMVSIFQDFPVSPDMVSEVKVLTANYEPQYGSTTSGQIMAVTKSGGANFRGALFEYHRNDALNARPWGADKKPKNLQNNFGGNIGGPVKTPVLWSDHVKSYFFFNFEGFRIKGGVNRPTLSIPSLQERTGDFTDWRDTSGNLIPIYDPATLRPNPNGSGFIKDQFMGCDGRSPNVICPNRISPLVQAWLNALPAPTSAGPLNNYIVPKPVPDTILAQSNYILGRYDLVLNNNDHFFLTIWHQAAPAKFESSLPQAIATETYSDPQESWVNRFNWDRTFTQSLLNHMSMGYLNRNEGYGAVDAKFVNDFPQIAGVAGHNVPPQIQFVNGEFNQLGSNAGVNVGNVTTRPTFIINDMVTWTKKTHTLKFGMEFRRIMGNVHSNTNEAGTFSFGRNATGLLGVTSGSPIASFLLGAVDNANVTYRAVSSDYPRQTAWVAHAGDTWQMTPKLTVNYGVRWDYYSPSSEKFDRFSFFDPNGANPGAAGRLGRLAFAGDQWGTASFGKPYPEDPWYGGIAPRLGAVYSLNDRTVLRTGYGIFYTQAFYPGWGGGISQDGFTNNAAFSSSTGGLAPAFLLDQGFPQDFLKPPVIQSDFRNGQSILYRPFDANERPYAHQWNITVDRELMRDVSLSVAYVGTAGRRLPSSLAPLNALDPRLLSMGNALYDEFKPGMTSLDGVALPYPGWVEQMTGCAPSVAQALLPYPQYCDRLQGLNENHGKSLYNSLQIKAEKRFSRGFYALVSYTYSHLNTSGSDNTQRGQEASLGVQGVLSPFDQGRAYVTALDDTPHVLSTAFVWEIPVGPGHNRLSSGVAGALLGGWQASTIFRYSSGVPFYFRSSTCNIPAQFRESCIPGIIDPAHVFAQDKGSFDPANGPLLNRAAFESPDSFNFYQGSGNPIEDTVRGFGYHNQDVTFIKNTKLPGNINFQFRAELFNIWNWHIYGARGNIFQLQTAGFNLDLASPKFGTWAGGVSDPRNVQIAARFEF